MHCSPELSRSYAERAKEAGDTVQAALFARMDPLTHHNVAVIVQLRDTLAGRSLLVASTHVLVALDTRALAFFFVLFALPIGVFL